MKKTTMPYLIGSLFLILFVATVWNYYFRAQKVTNTIIAADVTQLAQILNTIHKECVILSFEHQKNNIDFLNVIAFEGSEVGPINLKYPKKWRGAYLKDNPTMQEKYYQVVKTKNGHWVVPGDGVKLANGLVIGKDVVFDEQSSVPKFLIDQKFAAPIMTDNSEVQQDTRFQESIARERLRNM